MLPSIFFCQNIAARCFRQIAIHAGTEKPATLENRALPAAESACRQYRAVRWFLLPEGELRPVAGQDLLQHKPAQAAGRSDIHDYIPEHHPAGDELDAGAEKKAQEGA